MRRLNLNQIDNQVIRENFRTINDEFSNHPIIDGKWQSFDKDFAASGDFTIKHTLGFVPLDVIETRRVGAIVTYNFSEFSSDEISVSVAGETSVRFLLGRTK